MTEPFCLSPGTDTRPAIDACAKALRAGGVVIIPTDTVYGLAARSAFPNAIARIFEIKKRPDTKPLPYLIPDADALSAFVNHVPRRARRLMRKLWPGPLTLVLGAEGRTVAVRLPDHETTREVLRHAGGPVCATSANISGEPAAAAAGEIPKAIADQVDVFIDAGPAPLGRESTIVRVTDDERVVVLREGQVAARDVAEAAAITILIVCTGNTCRSPLAQAALTRRLADRLGVEPAELERRGFRVQSAGLSAWPGAPASAGALEVAEKRGLPLAAHRARPLTADLLSDADVVFTMSADHARRVRLVDPAFSGSVELFDPSGDDVQDPYGGPPEIYLECLERIEGIAASRAADLAASYGATAT